MLVHPETSPTVLTRQQRVWVALYSLATHSKSRAQILLENDVTEADLHEHEESWHTMRARRLHLHTTLAASA